MNTEVKVTILLSMVSGLIDTCYEQQERLEALETLLRKLPEVVPAKQRGVAAELVADLPVPDADSEKSGTLQILETAKLTIQGLSPKQEFQTRVLP